MVDLLCSENIFLGLLILNGVSAYLCIQARDLLIKEIRQHDKDLYRAIIYPHRAIYEMDFSGISALVFYSRFRRAIISGDFHELENVRRRQRAITFFNYLFVGCALCLAIDLIIC